MFGIRSRRHLGLFFISGWLVTSSSMAAELTPYQQFVKALDEPSLLNSGHRTELAHAPHRPLPDRNSLSVNAKKQQLGRELYHEKRLSVDGSLGCNNCHAGIWGGTDRKRVSKGVNGALGEMNSPTVFNAVFHFRQFWDGRVVTLEEQAKGPIENPVEMAHKLEAVVAALQDDLLYESAFSEIYPDGVTADNIVDALAEQEKVMITGDTNYDRYLKGDKEALSAQSKRGLQHFTDYGCVSCHNGLVLGGNSYQKLGVMQDYYSAQRPAQSKDMGLFHRTQREQDKHVFKVPSLRNIALTYPYLHDGSIPTLQQTVQLMAKYQTGRELPAPHLEAMLAFLNDLSSDFVKKRERQGKALRKQRQKKKQQRQKRLYQLDEAEQKALESAESPEFKAPLITIAGTDNDSTLGKLP